MNSAAWQKKAFNAGLRTRRTHTYTRTPRQRQSLTHALTACITLKWGNLRDGLVSSGPARPGLVWPGLAFCLLRRRIVRLARTHAHCMGLQPTTNTLCCCAVDAAANAAAFLAGRYGPKAVPDSASTDQYVLSCASRRLLLIFK